jgi:hypothetical protein
MPALIHNCTTVGDRFVVAFAGLGLVIGTWGFLHLVMGA